MLTTEMVPQTSWYSNLRSVIAPADWDVLRRRVYAQYGVRCGICGANGVLHCHERWEFDDSSHVQTLRGFIALCVMCHHVKHLGYAGILADQGRLDYDAVVDHFCRVNGCDRAAFAAHEASAFAFWRERSRYQWTVDLGQWASLVQPPEAPRTVSIPDRAGAPGVTPAPAAMPAEAVAPPLRPAAQEVRPAAAVVPEVPDVTDDRPTGYDLWLLRAAADPTLILRRHRRVAAEGGEAVYLSLTRVGADAGTCGVHFYVARKTAVSRLLGPSRRWLKATERERTGTDEGEHGEDGETAARLVLTDMGRTVLDSAQGRRAAKPDAVYLTVAELLAVLDDKRATRAAAEAERQAQYREAALKREREVQYIRASDRLRRFVDPLDSAEVAAAVAEGFAPVPPPPELRPSEVTEMPWVYAPPLRNSSYPRTTARGGKWMIFVPMAELDGAWEKVKAALADGRLGRSAKCSTALPSPNSSDPSEAVIIVYTYDGDDEADVWRVREGLREIGFRNTLSWKADAATRAGQYAVRGARGISRYRG